MEPTLMELYTLRLMVMHRGQLIAKLGKRIHAQRATIGELQDQLKYQGVLKARVESLVAEDASHRSQISVLNAHIKQLNRQIEQLKFVG